MERYSLRPLGCGFGSSDSLFYDIDNGGREMVTGNFTKGIVQPPDGGCWFCWNDTGDLVFDSEWDTYVHRSCIREALKEDPNHAEAVFMKYLLKNRETEGG